LLARVWPKLPGVVAGAAAMGFAWTAVSTPFTRREHGRVVGHVGVIELPLMVEGRWRRVASIHAVCTDADRRGWGLGRALMEAVLGWCDRRYDAIVLSTEIPRFYEKFGFRPIPEQVSARALSRRPGTPPTPARILTDRPEDVRVLRRLLSQRAPISERLGSVEDGTIFVIALLLTWGDFSRVHYCPALDVVTVHEVRDGMLVLYDVVGAVIPPVDALAEASGAAADRVVTLFYPDRLGGGFEAASCKAPHAPACGDLAFAGPMARGSVPDTGFMLPPLSRT
jgi:ribosomal protein S18 acetylase RimI-like enzyme